MPQKELAEAVNSYGDFIIKELTIFLESRPLFGGTVADLMSSFIKAIPMARNLFQFVEDVKEAIVKVLRTKRFAFEDQGCYHSTAMGKFLICFRPVELSTSTTSSGEHEKLGVHGQRIVCAFEDSV